MKKLRSIVLTTISVTAALAVSFGLSKVRANSEELPAGLTAEQKKKIAGLINEGLSLENASAIKPEEIRVNTGQPPELNAQLISTRFTPWNNAARLKSAAWFEADNWNGFIAKVKQPISCTLVIKKYENNRSVEERIRILSKEFLTYAFDPIYSRPQNCVFFKYGQDETEMDGRGLYVLNLMNLKVTRVDPNFVTEVSDKLSPDGRFIWYMGNLGDAYANYGKVFNAGTGRSSEIASGANFCGDFRWVGNRAASLSYSWNSAFSKGMGRRRVDSIFDAGANKMAVFAQEKYDLRIFDSVGPYAYRNSATAELRMRWRSGEETIIGQLPKIGSDEVVGPFGSGQFYLGSGVEDLDNGIETEEDPTRRIHRFNLRLLKIEEHQPVLVTDEVQLKSSAEMVDSSVIGADQANSVLVAVRESDLSSLQRGKGENVLIYRYDFPTSQWSFVEKYTNAFGLFLESANSSYSAVKFNF